MSIPNKASIIVIELIQILAEGFNELSRKNDLRKAAGSFARSGTRESDGIPRAHGLTVN